MFNYLRKSTMISEVKLRVVVGSRRKKSWCGVIVVKLFVSDVLDEQSGMKTSKSG